MISAARSWTCAACVFTLTAGCEDGGGGARVDGSILQQALPDPDKLRVASTPMGFQDGRLEVPAPTREALLQTLIFTDDVGTGWLSPIGAFQGVMDGEDGHEIDVPGLGVQPAVRFEVANMVLLLWEQDDSNFYYQIDQTDTPTVIDLEGGTFEGIKDGLGTIPSPASATPTGNRDVGYIHVPETPDGVGETLIEFAVTGDSREIFVTSGLAENCMIGTQRVFYYSETGGWAMKTQPLAGTTGVAFSVRAQDAGCSTLAVDTVGAWLPGGEGLVWQQPDMGLLPPIPVAECWDGGGESIFAEGGMGPVPYSGSCEPVFSYVMPTVSPGAAQFLPELQAIEEAVGCDGDGVREGYEQCDGSDFGDDTCMTVLMQPEGNLQCNADCSLNTEMCTGMP